MKYHRVSEIVTVDRWFRLGDLPGDKPVLPNGDGRIVKAYAREDVHAAAPCMNCGSPMSTHGWIDPPEAAVPPESVMPVDPVSGKQMEPPPPPEYPKTFSKAKHIDEIAGDAAREKELLAEGFHHVKAAPAPKPAPPAKPAKLDPERGDLKGLAVCPGDYVVTEPSGERSTVRPEKFALEYTKVF